jgi:EAL domain-containing protein (putative c-di-GMP-specific phosphodiesterase class I)/ActR/RegA family two-component response regulator
MLTSSSAGEATPANALPAPAPRARVLVVEDDRGLLELYADILLDEGYEVACALSGSAALREIESRPCDVVLTDVVMPECSGVDVLRALRERDLDVPVVLVTGSPSVETAVQAVELGAVHYLVKPVERSELLRSVSRAAGLRRLAKTKREALRYLGGGNGKQSEEADAEALFARALRGLYMVYQPIVRARDASVYAWEALLRTSEPRLASPLTVLELAERLGRVHDLGRAIRAQVAAAASRERGVVYFVNLHPDDLLDERLFEPAAPLSACASEVVLELTERSSIEGVPDVRDRIRRLRALGFRIAVDDLGSGYSGLTSFAQLEPDFVKLDRALITGIDANDRQS